MSDEAIIAQVSAILDGWTATPNNALAKRVGENWLIGGFIDGTCFYKHTGLAPDGPETPDDPIEAAHWLVAHVAALRGPTSQPEESPAPSGVFDSEGPDNAADDAGQAEMGDSVDADFVDSGDIGGVPEADFDAGLGDPDYSGAEPVGDVAADDPEPEAEAVAYPGMMIAGDPLKAAKNDAREALAQKQRSILDRYPWQDNLRDFDQMQSVRWAIAEGTHPPFDDEEQAEFDALSTFSNWFGRVNQNAFNITVQIDDAETIEAVQAIDIEAGWPE